MNLVLEILGTAITSGGSVIGAYAIKHRLTKNRPDTHGALPWLWRNEKKGIYGIYCIKCRNIDKNNVQPPICDCLDYPDLHFHFECKDCGFKSLMRTADK